MSTDKTIDVESQEVESDLSRDDGMLALVTKAEIDTQISTAKRFPRDIKKFRVESQSLACLDADVAGECFYRLERKDSKTGKIKIIEGPSARLAEIVASAWGNCRAAARVIDENENFVVAQGAFIDLERNVAITYESRRSIRGKYGRFSNDMVGVTANAACSIALRNAVFKGVPKAFWVSAYEEAVKTYRGDHKTLVERRDTMLTYFKKIGVPEDRVLAKIEKPNTEAIDLDDLVRLKGFATAIKEGDTTIEETFPIPGQPLDPGKTKSEQLADTLKKTAPPKGDDQNLDARRTGDAEGSGVDGRRSEPASSNPAAPLPAEAAQPSAPPSQREADDVEQFIADVAVLSSILDCKNAMKMIPAAWSPENRQRAVSKIEMREAEIRGSRGGRANQ